MATAAALIHSIDFQENPLANVKRIDCALLPPSCRTLAMKVRRTQYVAALWTRAATSTPGDGLSPTEYGWCLNDNLLTPIWYEGPAIPDNLFTSYIEDIEIMESELEVDSDVWSEDSDSEDAEM